MRSTALPLIPFSSQPGMLFVVIIMSIVGFLLLQVIFRSRGGLLLQQYLSYTAAAVVYFSARPWLLIDRGISQQHNTTQQSTIRSQVQNSDARYITSLPFHTNTQTHTHAYTYTYGSLYLNTVPRPRAKYHSNARAQTPYLEAFPTAVLGS